VEVKASSKALDLVVLQIKQVGAINFLLMFTKNVE
jgi:hypothetical protein